MTGMTLAPQAGEVHPVLRSARSWGARCAVMASLATLCGATMTVARSETQTEAYLSLRNRFIATETARDKAIDSAADEIRKREGNDASDAYRKKAEAAGWAEIQRERSELGERLGALIGPVSVRGLPAKGEINLAELSATAGIGFGQLDGLSFNAADDTLQLVVTTKALLENWLLENKDHATSHFEFDMPQDVQRALRFAPFYTYAVEEDAAVYSFGEIPIAPRHGDEAGVALLATITQDEPATPTHLIAAVMGQGKAFILVQKLKVAVQRFARCDKIQDDAERRRRKVTAEERPVAKPARPATTPMSGRELDLLQEERRIDADGEAAYDSCVGEQVRRQRYYPSIARQAQALVDLVPTD